MIEWINVKDRLPEIGIGVIFLMKYDHPHLYFHNPHFGKIKGMFISKQKTASGHTPHIDSFMYDDWEIIE